MTLEVGRPLQGAPLGHERASLLDVKDLSVEFRLRKKVVHAVNGFSCSVSPGETLAILGESGSGKSVTAHAIMGTLNTTTAKVTGGEVWFEGRDLLRLPDRERRRVRGRKIAIIFQDSLSALNPLFTVANQIGEMFRFHDGMNKRAAERAAVDLMGRVGIPDARRRAGAYPHEFSGGMRQRIMIAMALALDPALLIADEPTTALDVTVQAQIMELLKDLQREMGMGLVLITHDLGVVADMADRIVVMYAGKAVEVSPVHDLYSSPGHPYTAGLLQSIPRLDSAEDELRPIGGAPPDMTRLATGCSFQPRCRWAQNICKGEPPPLRTVADGRRSACHFAEAVLHGDEAVLHGDQAVLVGDEASGDEHA
ncbi:MAG TPA: ABC transporter ATP-binding protein [Acidimicrobiales bacterium]|nr:ABC transporter ATP-binding protein [Acidimicrobiales bacterium]